MQEQPAQMHKIGFVNAKEVDFHTNTQHFYVGGRHSHDSLSALLRYCQTTRQRLQVHNEHVVADQIVRHRIPLNSFGTCLMVEHPERFLRILAHEIISAMPAKTKAPEARLEKEQLTRMLHDAQVLFGSVPQTQSS